MSCNRAFALLVLIGLGISSPSDSPAQGIPMATATLICGRDDDPDGFTRELTGVFSRADSILFNSACDQEEIFGTVNIKDLVDVLAISGPRAGVVAEATSTVDITPDSTCDPDERTIGFGFTRGAGVITFSAALSEKGPPPFRPAVVPGKAVVGATVKATVEPPSSPSDVFGPGEDPNAAWAEAGVIFGNGNLPFIHLLVKSTDGISEENIVDKEFPLDLLTNGDLMEFTKFADADVQTSSAPLCVNGDRAHAAAIATIDPIIDFDQAAFDAQHGAESYTLSDFYQIDISPNLNVLLHEDGFEPGPVPPF